MEPKPFHNGRGLLDQLQSIGEEKDVWAIVSDLLRADLAVAPEHFFGLKYPARGNGVEWLMLYMSKRVKLESGGHIIQNEEQKKVAFEQVPIFVLRVQRLRPETLRFRNNGVVDGTITCKTVALIGLGALGSMVADLLGKAGVGHFRLCDNDVLETGNTARHVGGISQFGALKTWVIMKRLLDINPFLEFEVADILNASAVHSLEALERFIKPVDLVVCTTADESAESVINQVALMGKKTVLYGRSLRRASMGRVFLVRPGQDACKACLAHYAISGRQGMKTPDDWIDVPEDPNDVIYHECGRPVIAGSGIDLSFTASLIARIALDVLEGKDSENNHWLWSRNPASDIDTRLSKEMTIVAGTLAPHSECPACQEPDIVELVMTEQVRHAIDAVSAESPDTETGGVLIGFVDDQRRAVALRATGPGPKAIKTPTEFRRDVEYIQAELDQAASELGPRGSYIGEWHTHLVPQLDPSPTDIESLFGISSAVNYLTRCPVMVIATLDPITKEISQLGSWVFMINGRMYSIPHRLIDDDLLNGSKVMA